MSRQPEQGLAEKVQGTVSRDRDECCAELIGRRRKYICVQDFAVAAQLNPQEKNPL